MPLISEIVVVVSFAAVAVAVSAVAVAVAEVVAAAGGIAGGDADDECYDNAAAAAAEMEGS